MTNFACPLFHFESLTNLDIFTSIEGKQYSPSEWSIQSRSSQRNQCTYEDCQSEKIVFDQINVGYDRFMNHSYSGVGLTADLNTLVIGKENDNLTDAF
jgi:hypothetical protein